MCDASFNVFFFDIVVVIYAFELIFRLDSDYFF